MRRWLPAVLFGLVGCGFQSGVSPGDDDVPDAGGPDDEPAGGIDDPDEVVHVGAADEFLGTGDLNLVVAATIDTSALTISTGLPAGVTFTAAAQDGGGPELAILHVRHFESGADLRVTGARPLVVIAQDVAFSGALRAGGDDDGAGAVTAGPGLGGDGMQRGFDDEGGGGGGGAATAGARGGGVGALVGGRAGEPTGTAGLVGGAGGGRTFLAPLSPCGTSAPGRGGGAIQLSARTQVAVSGTIDVGGGGGGGGVDCLVPPNWLAGHGGGGGGTIVLQAPRIANTGRLSANGGGGGAGGGALGDGGKGERGQHAVLPETAPARGGAARGSLSAPGGDGATALAPAQPGGNGEATGNAGGGGGGLGRIVLLYRTQLELGATSPRAETATYASEP